MKSKYIVGIDEAGRGPLAGPVAVGVAVVPGNFEWKETLPGVNDSKQLSELQREDIYMKARRLQAAGQLDFAVSMVSAKVIDRIGIVPAVTLAMNRALQKIEANLNVPVNRYINNDWSVRLDGGLVAPKRFTNQATIIKGDATEPVIGLASICAKVTRDRYMVRKSSEKIFAPYHFATHKGYGTKAHRAAISKNGLSPLHRKTYCKNINLT